MKLLGVDGGQTSTKMALYDADSGKLYRQTGPPIDHMLTAASRETGRIGIRNTLSALLAETGTPERVDAAVIGLSGLRPEHEPLLRRWVSELVRVERFVLTGDVKTNLAGASAGRNDGILVIAGGGSIAYYADGSGREHVSGGFGHLLGDEGSAYWIGLSALKAAIRAADGRDPSTRLTGLMLERFRTDSFWDVKKRLHAEAITREHIAALAELTDRAADDGDETARRILREAGEQLGLLVVSLTEKLRAVSEELPSNIYISGGVFRSKRWVVPAFCETVFAANLRMRVEEPAYPPVIGALLIGFRQLGLEWPEASVRRQLAEMCADAKQGGEHA